MYIYNAIIVYIYIIYLYIINKTIISKAYKVNEL